MVEVSVCIITYAHERYIKQALDSALNQITNFEYEVIVAEDKSPDNTREILLDYKQKYGDKLVLILQEHNKGPSQNFSDCRMAARGKYIALLEGDDYWTDRFKLQKQYDVLENNPQYSAVSHDYMTISSEGKFIRKNLYLRKNKIYNLRHYLRNGYTLHTCTLFYRNVFSETDERYKKLRNCAPTMSDIITFVLLYDKGDIYAIKDTMAAHRMASVSDVTSFSFQQGSKAVEYSYMYKTIIENLEEYLNYKYDLSPLMANRMSSIMLNKILGNIDYDNRKLMELFNSLSLKTRIMTCYKIVRRLIIKVIRRIQIKVDNNNE